MNAGGKQQQKLNNNNKDMDNSPYVNTLNNEVIVIQ